MKNKLFFLFISIALYIFPSCNNGKELNMQNTDIAYNNHMLNNANQLYYKIYGLYNCEDIKMTIWLYEDGTFVEKNKWGWFGGTYEFDKPFSNMDYYYVRLMKLYPPTRDQSVCNIKYIYTPNTNGLPDHYYIFDRDGAPVNIINFIFFDSSDKQYSYWVKTSEDTIPINAKYIHISDGTAVISGKVPYLQGYNIVFFIRPNFNRCNLQWNESKGLVYVSDNGKIYSFKKRTLELTPRITPPIGENESFQDGEIVYPRQY